MAVYKVGDFKFDNEETAKKAAKELKATQYILNQLKDADDVAVLSIYNRLLAQNIFETDLGRAFLKQLEDNLLASGLLEPKVTSDVEVRRARKEESFLTDDKKQLDKIEKNRSNTKRKNSKKANKKITLEEKYNRLCILNKILIVICVGLVISIAAMFFINSTINSPTILDYEEQILDKYSNWEQELTKREEALRQREIEQ